MSQVFVFAFMDFIGFFSVSLTGKKNFQAISLPSISHRVTMKRERRKGDIGQNLLLLFLSNSFSLPSVILDSY